MRFRGGSYRVLAVLYSFSFLLSFNSAQALTADCSGDLDPDVQVLNSYRFAQTLNFEKIKTILSFFTGENKLWGGTRLTERYSKNARELTRQMILHFLKNLGYSPTIEPFEGGANIVLEIPGTDLKNEVVELGAHFDTAEADVPGADDNGTGLALVLHLAEKLKNETPRRTVRLVFFDLEEKEGEGSTHHAMFVKQDPRNFIAAYIFDMIGYVPPEAKNWIMVAEIAEGRRKKKPAKDDDDEEDSEYKRTKYLPPPLTRRESKTFKKRSLEIGKNIFYQLGRLPVDRRVALSPEIENSAPWSGDHGSYWEFGLPAIMFATPFEGKYESSVNHTSRDVISNMTWEYYVSTAKICAELAAALMKLEPRNSPQEHPAENRNLLVGIIPPSIPREEELLEVEEKEEDSSKEKEPRLNADLSERLRILRANPKKRILITSPGAKGGLVLYAADELDFEVPEGLLSIVKEEFARNGGALEVFSDVDKEFTRKVRSAILNKHFPHEDEKPSIEKRPSNSKSETADKLSSFNEGAFSGYLVQVFQKIFQAPAVRRTLIVDEKEKNAIVLFDGVDSLLRTADAAFIRALKKEFAESGGHFVRSGPRAFLKLGRQDLAAIEEMGHTLSDKYRKLDINGGWFEWFAKMSAECPPKAESKFGEIKDHGSMK
jgi:hypothetical protein